MDLFFSCDWGTSSLRLRLVSLPDLKVVADENSDEGIAFMFDLWNKQNVLAQNRFDFYLSILEEKVKAIKEKVAIDLNNIPLVISGMASSTIGMIDLPYKLLPIETNGEELTTKVFNQTKNFPHNIIIVSGLRSEDDVIRGEETQLIGSISSATDGFFIFPGTHSKHVWVKDSRVVDFKTFMTGEFFHLLTTKSILSSSVDVSPSFGKKEKEVFKKGVQDGQAANILHASFLVRTNLLFDKYSRQENFYYLSGMLLGNELKEIGLENRDVFLIGSKEQCEYYQTAMEILYPSLKILVIDAGQATIKGHYKILLAAGKLSEKNLLS